jgi:transposase InsO family protein
VSKKKASGRRTRRLFSSEFKAKVALSALREDRTMLSCVNNRSFPSWELDTAYIRMERGFMYLSAVVDVYSRRILAHRVAITKEGIYAKEVLGRYGTPQIVNTDRGAQFTAQEFVDTVLTAKARLSMDGGGLGVLAWGFATTCLSNSCGAR